MQVQGTVKAVMPIQQVTDSFKKREFVITTQEEYPQDILLQVTQDKCALFNDVQIGQTITAHFNLRGREWINPNGEAKYFNTLDAWRIEKGQVNETSRSAVPNPTVDDDLPF